MTLTIRVFARCGRLLRFRLSFQNAPISLEVDYRPVIGAVIGGGHDGFFDPGFWNFGLSVKFHFETMNDRYIFLIAV